jgi:hypothetical protein
MKKTALQWFIEQIENHNGVTRAGFQKCIDEALEMEKEQITNAWLHGKLMHNSRIDYHEVYYNKTYKNK